jgi:hypothetical protein
MNKEQKKQDGNKGTALLMTIMMLNIILLSALTAASIMSSGIKMSGTQMRSTQAFFAAESGAERVLWEWRKNGWVIPGGAVTGAFSSTLLNGSSYQVDKDATPSPTIFQCHGFFGNLQRTVELRLFF